MSEEAVNKIKFWEIFSSLPEGSIKLDHNLIINGVRFNAGTEIHPGETLAGVDLIKRKGIDLALVATGDTYILRGFYLPDGE